MRLPILNEDDAEASHVGCRLLNEYKIRVYFNTNGARYQAGETVQGFIAIAPISSIGKFGRPARPDDSDCPEPVGLLQMEVQLSGSMVIGKGIAQQNNLQEGAFMKTSNKDNRKNLPKHESQSCSTDSWDLLDSYVVNHMRAHNSRRTYDCAPDIIQQDPTTYFMLSKVLELMYRPPPNFRGVPSPSYTTYQFKESCNEWGKRIGQRYLPQPSLFGADERGNHAQLLVSSPVIRLPMPDFTGDNAFKTQFIAFGFDTPYTLPPSIDRGTLVEDCEAVNILYAVHINATWAHDPAKTTEEHGNKWDYRGMDAPLRAERGIPWAVLPAVPNKQVSFSVPIHIELSPLMVLRPFYGQWRQPNPYLGGASNKAWVNMNLDRSKESENDQQSLLNGTSGTAPLFGLGTRSPQSSGRAVDFTSHLHNLPVMSSILNVPSIRHITGSKSQAKSTAFSSLPLFDFKPMRSSEWALSTSNEQPYLTKGIRKRLLDDLMELSFPSDAIFDPGYLKQEAFIKRLTDTQTTHTANPALDLIVQQVRVFLEQWNPWFQYNAVVAQVGDIIPSKSGIITSQGHSDRNLQMRRFLERQAYYPISSDISRAIELEATRHRFTTEVERPGWEAKVENEIWQGHATPSIFDSIESLVPLKDLASFSQQLHISDQPCEEVDWNDIDSDISEILSDSEEDDYGSAITSHRTISARDSADEHIVIKLTANLKLSFDELRNFGLLSVDAPDMIQISSDILPPNPKASILSYMLCAHEWIGADVLRHKQNQLREKIQSQAPWLRNHSLGWADVDVSSFFGILKKNTKTFFMTPGSKMILTFNTTKASVVSTQADISLVRSTYWLNEKDKRLVGVPNITGGGFLQQILGVGFTGLTGGTMSGKVEEEIVHRWPSVKLLYSRIRRTDVELPAELLPATFYSDAINVSYHLAIRFTCVAENGNKVKDEVLPQLKKLGPSIQPMIGCPYPPPIGNTEQTNTNISWRISPESMNDSDIKHGRQAGPRNGELFNNPTCRSAIFDTLTSWTFNLPLIILPCGTLDHCKT